jgi:hypothetical protein
VQDPGVNLPKLIRWHLQNHAAPYQLALYSALALTAFAGVAVCFQNRERQQMAEERTWPLVQGIVLESKITETDRSSESDFSTMITASGIVKYPHPTGEITTPFYLESSSLPPRDWQANFAPGAGPVLRYDLEDPKQFAFIDFLGHP